MQPAASDPVGIAPVTDAEAHLLVARDWMIGMEVLVTAKPMALRAFCHLGAQAVDSLLAAFILTKAQGKDDNVVGGRDLLAMWRTASDLGLRLERPLPAWLIQVARGHKSPYATRYQAGKRPSGPVSRLHAIGYPNASELRAGVLNLETLVAPHVEAHLHTNR